MGSGQTPSHWSLSGRIVGLLVLGTIAVAVVVAMPGPDRTPWEPPPDLAVHLPGSLAPLGADPSSVPIYADSVEGVSGPLTLPVLLNASELLYSLERSPAVEVARTYRFSPALEGDVPVAVWVVLPVEFPAVVTEFEAEGSNLTRPGRDLE